MTVLRQLLDEQGFLLLDGATGTELFSRGLGPGDPPELWNVEEQEKIIGAYTAYVEAGCDLFLTNSFGGTHYRLALHKLDDRVGELNERASALGRQVADAVDRTVLVAGSMGPTGELMEPMGSMTAAACTAAFTQQAEGLAAGGADVLWIETMSSTEEASAAVAGARAACDLPVCLTLSFDTAGRTMMGVTGTAAAELAVELGVDAIGANCGNNLADTEAAIKQMREFDSDLIVISKGNAGIPQWHGTELHYNGTPEVMAAYAARARDLGVELIGACCGSTPEHIAKMRAVLDGVEPVPEVEEIVATTQLVAKKRGKPPPPSSVEAADHEMNPHDDLLGRHSTSSEPDAPFLFVLSRQDDQNIYAIAEGEPERDLFFDEMLDPELNDEEEPYYIYSPVLRSVSPTQALSDFERKGLDVARVECESELFSDLEAQGVRQGVWTESRAATLALFSEYLRLEEPDPFGVVNSFYWQFYRSWFTLCQALLNPPTWLEKCLCQIGDRRVSVISFEGVLRGGSNFAFKAVVDWDNEMRLARPQTEQGHREFLVSPGASEFRVVWERNALDENRVAEVFRRSLPSAWSVHGERREAVGVLFISLLTPVIRMLISYLRSEDGSEVTLVQDRGGFLTSVSFHGPEEIKPLLSTPPASR